MTSQAQQAAAEAKERAHTVGLIASLREKRDEEQVQKNLLIASLVEDARAAGTPWEMIAEAMRMTPNGVRDFLRRHGEG